MLRWCCLIALAASACGFHSPKGSGGGDDGDDASVPPGDGSSTVDAPADTRSPWCFGSFVEICLAAAPGPAISVNAGDTLTIDTRDNSPDCVATTAGAGACVVAAASIAVNGTIRGQGPRPLVLLATGAITINTGGLIDVASHRGNTNLGAGANPPQPRCMPGSPPTARTGGWGGSNASKGGDGNQAGAGSSGGNAANALSRPAAALFGGCAGSKGAGNSGGSGGAGGGAVDLIAAAIVINDTINASGAGASGATDNGEGGGGGGSGGLIVLDAPEVTINGAAKVFAQGGGGGEGGRSGGNGAGNDGADPTAPNQAAQGGNNAGSGGDGGDGATTGNGGNGGDDTIATDDGGGGGGGGRGFIITTDPSPPSPPPANVCPAFS
ncbi:MAG TPA: hypothetical protein VNO30_36465 [Kofleriaceae bacterium]|nr:hypothetical protein [Kofleriaceae bacterium]